MRLSSAGISSRSMSHFNPRSPSGLRQKFKVNYTVLVDFNPRSPRGLRPIIRTGFHPNYKISIHAAQEGCDPVMFGKPGWRTDDFNPRSPRGLRQYSSAFHKHLNSISIHAAQEGCDNDEHMYWSTQSGISIHAAQEGCDRSAWAVSIIKCYFNPRSPRGLRLQASIRTYYAKIFQSTQPKRAATKITGNDKILNLFQSTQPKRAATETQKQYA